MSFRALNTITEGEAIVIPIHKKNGRCNHPSHNGNGNGHQNHGNGNGNGHDNHGNGNGYGHHHNCDNLDPDPTDVDPLKDAYYALVARYTELGLTYTVINEQITRCVQNNDPVLNNIDFVNILTLSTDFIDANAKVAATCPTLVSVPGSRCTGAANHSWSDILELEDVSDCIDYGTVNMPTPDSYAWADLPCSGGGGGDDGNGTTGPIGDGGGGNPTGNSGDDGDDDPCGIDLGGNGQIDIELPEEPEEDPCLNQDDDITALNNFLADTNINNKITALETIANQNGGNEDGQEYQQNPDGSFTPIAPTALGSGETTFPDAAGNSVLRIHAHTNDRTHSPSWDDTFAAWPAFLHQQIAAANTQFENSLTNELTFMVVSKSGIIAFRVEDLAEIANTYSFYAQLDEDSSEKHAKASALLKWENQYKIEAVKDCQSNGGCTDNEYQEKIVEKWLEKIKNNKLGTSTYRAIKDANGDYQWECLN
ncbi:hypothetical protein [Aurantibacter sp.]|uniref:hypothetical protein n=1 Tax=Aurantibacter sp. TaxID=2807103 RepID=UPI0035C8232B